MTQKADLRKHYRDLRASLPLQRCREAAASIAKQVKSFSSGLVLSYDPFRNEVDLSEINAWLALQKRLVLTRRAGDELEFYRVEDLSLQTEASLLEYREPIARLCSKIPLSAIDIALVPGLSFDEERFRLGYGKGYYDRLLRHGVPSIGIGFYEQKSPRLLPRDPWDIPVGQLIFV